MGYLKTLLRKTGYRKGKKPIVVPPVTPENEFRTLVYDLQDLKSKRSTYANVKAGTADNLALRTAVDKLVSEGEGLLSKAPYSVTTKPKTFNSKAIDYLPQTDMRDARSDAVYLWPRTGNKLVNDSWVYDSATAYVEPVYSAAVGQKGAVLPGAYIKRTKANPAANYYGDTKKLEDISVDIKKLGGAYFYTQDERYAQKALALIEYFFTSPTTGMKPNVRFLSVARGSSEWGGYGTGSGFVIAETLHEVCEGFQLIRNSQTVKSNAAKETAFLDWIRQLWYYYTKVWTNAPAKPTSSSTTAQKEDYYHWKQLWDSYQQAGIYTQWNNIRVLFIVNVLTFAYILGETDWVNDHINKYVFDSGSKKGLVSRNFPSTPGTFGGVAYDAFDMPEENARAIPWTYSMKALTGWVDLARIGVNVGLDIANYTSPSGANMKKGVERVLYLLENPTTYRNKGKEDIASHDLFWFAASRLRPLTAIYPNDTTLKNRIRAYLTQLNTKYATKNPERSEAYYQQGKTGAYAFETINY